MSEFDQVGYWRARHRSLVGDPGSVGNLGKSVEENVVGEERVQAVVARAAELLRPAKTVLDVGCGYGRVAACFTDLGYDYLGVDVSAEATKQASERHASARFTTADLATWETDQCFDVVCALYVFVHFVDDVGWSSIVTRAMSWVAPGGALLLADAFSDERQAIRPHVVLRPLTAYVAKMDSEFTFDNAFREDLIGSGSDRMDFARQFYLARRRSTAQATYAAG